MCKRLASFDSKPSMGYIPGRERNYDVLYPYERNQSARGLASRDKNSDRKSVV